MTRDDLDQMLNQITDNSQIRDMVKTAVDAYTSALLKQCNVSGALPQRLDAVQLFNKIKHWDFGNHPYPSLSRIDLYKLGFKQGMIHLERLIYCGNDR